MTEEQTQKLVRAELVTVTSWTEKIPRIGDSRRDSTLVKNIVIFFFYFRNGRVGVMSKNLVRASHGDSEWPTEKIPRIGDRRRDSSADIV